MSPDGVCEAAEDGTACGTRGECSAGTCVFPEADATCDLDFATAPADAYLVIACDHDLEGEDIELAEGVTLEYGGGSISNGSLRLAGGTISAELLGPTLDIRVDERSGGALGQSSFYFDAERWGLEEGEVSNEVATANRARLNQAIRQVATLGGASFVVGALDVFLEVQEGPFQDRAVSLPSDFHLQMCDDTHLRVQPGLGFEYSLLWTKETRNVHISGGHLWGDRDTHDYAAGGEHPQDQGIGISISGAVDVLVEGVTANRFIGDGLNVGVAVRRNPDGSPVEGRQYAANVTVRDCVFDENRRNGLSLTDVEGAVLERLRVTRTALGDVDVDGRSAGVTPRYGLDIEPFQPSAGDGTDALEILEEVTDVVIRDSTFSDNFQGDIDFFKCHRVQAYGNTFGGGVASVGGFEVEVYDNVFLADGDDRGIGVNVKPLIREDGTHFVRDWVVRDNRISGFGHGINIGGQNQRVEANTIEDFDAGIFVLTGVDNVFVDNTLSSRRPQSRGYTNFPDAECTGEVSGGTVHTDLEPLRLVRLNETRDGEGILLVDDVSFTSATQTAVKIQQTNDLTIQNCVADGYDEQLSGDNVNLIDNAVH